MLTYLYNATAKYQTVCQIEPSKIAMAQAELPNPNRSTVFLNPRNFHSTFNQKIYKK